MSKNNNQQLFPTVMNANDLIYQERVNFLTIRRKSRPSFTIEKYIFFAIGCVILGLYLYSVEFTRLGLGLIGIAVSILIPTIRVREREKEAINRIIEIDSTEIRVRNRFKQSRVRLDEIREFKTKIARYKKIYHGRITLVLEGGRSHEFLELFNSDRDLLEEDMIIISNYIVDNFYED